MNLFITIGILLIGGYLLGHALEKIDVPKIVGFIAVGILFSPKTLSLTAPDFVISTAPVQQLCLAFITFEVGGALKWSRIREHGKEIINITLLASFFPFVLIFGGIFLLAQFYPLDSLSQGAIISFALIMGALASPTAPEATLAVMHQYHARGQVSDTIMGVAALDDVLGILLFSLVIATSSAIGMGAQDGSSLVIAGMTLYRIFGALVVGSLLAVVMNRSSKALGIENQGQWIVLIFSLIISCYGLSILIHVDELLACMTMGIVTSNRNPQQRKIFKIIERYTEELVFLFFFVLSGLHLDISTLPKASLIILVFVLLRTLGKVLGAVVGGKLAKADPAIQKYTSGGLLPQGGIVIGLTLSIYGEDVVGDVSDLLLMTIMGATIVHELLGPVAAKHSLQKAGEIRMNSRS